MLRKIFILLFVFIVTFFGQKAFCISNNELPSETGKVLGVEYTDSPAIKQGTDSTKQLVKVKITSGKFRGETVFLENMLTGNPAYDINLKKNDNVILHVESINDKYSSPEDVRFYIADLQRDNILWLVCSAFCVLLILIGRKKGIYSLVSIIATAALIFLALVPMILNGINPLLATVIIGLLSTIITIYLVSGFNAKSTSAILGTGISLIIAGILSAVIIQLAHLTGFAGEENIFLYTAHPALNFKGILASCIIIAALGALMDTSVSIASTINEILETDNSLSVKQLFTSGMNVGRDVIGTMSNTLILVYLGSSLPLVLLSSNIDFQKFFNLNQVATEISSAIIGSIAILICVPITAIISSILIKKYKSEEFDFNKDSFQ